MPYSTCIDIYVCIYIDGEKYVFHIHIDLVDREIDLVDREMGKNP